MPVNQARIPLPKPTQTAGANWTASCVITVQLFATLCEMPELQLGDYSLQMGEGRDDILWRYAEAAEFSLEAAWASAYTVDARQM